MNFVHRGKNYRYMSYCSAFHKKLGFRLKVGESKGLGFGANTATNHLFLLEQNVKFARKDLVKKK